MIKFLPTLIPLATEAVEDPLAEVLSLFDLVPAHTYTVERDEPNLRVHAKFFRLPEAKDVYYAAKFRKMIVSLKITHNLDAYEFDISVNKG